MTTPTSKPAQTPEKVAMEEIRGCFFFGKKVGALDEERAQAALRKLAHAAAQAERERIAAELLEEAAGLRRVTWGKSAADYGASLLERIADRLHPAPEGT